MVHNDDEWLRCLGEAANHLFPYQNRQLFASILFEINPPNCLQPWMNIPNQIIEHFLNDQRIEKI
jgi:hypothetical protein